MSFSSQWCSRKFQVRFLFAVLATSTCTLASTQAADQSLTPGPDLFQQLDDHVLLSNDSEVIGSDVGLDNPFRKWVSMPDSDETSAVQISNSSQSASQFLRVSLGDGHDGCELPFDNNACPCVYARVEALFLKRHPRFSNRAIVVDDTTGTTLLSTSDLDYNYDPGLQATFGMRICDGRALEFTYFGLFDGNANGSAASSGAGSSLILGDNLFGNVFVDMDLTRVNYSSWLNSFELNLPCCCGCCEQGGCGECGECGKCGECGECGEGGGSCGSGFGSCQSCEWFGGFRYINLGEDLNIYAERTVGGGVESGSYDLRTRNHLYGAQLGARMRRTQGRLGYEAGGKAGLYVNDAQQEQTVTDFPNFPLRNTSHSSNTAAFVGEANLTGLYRLTRVWNLRAGYNVMWIEGLALAPDQLDFDFASAQGGNRLDNGSGMFLHGVNVGIEARW
jgi:hypothetical protein